jgi:predicted  nucleic acid-binding Zn-ribbon protein
MNSQSNEDTTMTKAERIKNQIAKLQAQLEDLEPKVIKVRSLMTGQEVEVMSNTPWSCRPDSETYWSM